MTPTEQGMTCDDAYECDDLVSMADDVIQLFLISCAI